MQYEFSYPHSTRSYYSNRNLARRWRAAQRALKLPLPILDPALRTLYVSAMELQAESPNIVTCNPFNREAEELPYPLTGGRRPRAVATTGLRAYAQARRMGWCCWCSLCTERPKFAIFAQDQLGPFLECYQCGFYVPLEKTYETATTLGGYPFTANGALQPFIKALAIPPPEGKQGTRLPQNQREIRREHSTPYSLRPRVKVKVERDSPELPNTLDEILAGINLNKKEKPQRSSRRQQRSARGSNQAQPMDVYEEAAAGHDEDHTKIEFCPYCGAGFVEDLMDDHLKEDCIEYANYDSA